VVLSQAVIPSAYHHPLTTTWPSALQRPALHRVLWWLTRRLLNPVLLPEPNARRRQLGLPLWQDALNEGWLSPSLTLVGISPHLCGRQPDWPESHALCGFLDMPNPPQEGQWPDGLSAFLEAGEAPVYIGFGSWMPKALEAQAAELARLREAVERAGCRAIIQSENAAACGFSSNERILHVAATPHQMVFPRCRAIVHHGGAGTTQAALRAGRPSVVVANLSEQEHWGRLLQRLGVALPPLHRRSLTAPNLARALRQVLSQPALREQAQALGAAMAHDTGVASAVSVVEHWAAQKVQSVGGLRAPAGV
jgi:UDP:flavonoid glycosyltransferase YjiC (YdhE family)